MKKKVIYAACISYKLEQLEDFLQSIQASLENYKVVLIADRISIRDIRQHELSEHIQLVKYKGVSKFIFQTFYGKFKWSRLFSFFILPYTFLLSRLPDSLYRDNLLNKIHYPSVNRYLLLRREINKLKEDCWVIITDARDVLFQGDPTIGAEVGSFHTGVESQVMEESITNKNWYSRIYSQESYNKVRDEKVICSGVSFSNKKNMQDYLDKVVHEIIKFTPIIALQHGYDQPIHNYLIRNGRLSSKVKLHENSLGTICTLGSWGYSKMVPVSFTKEGKMLFEENIPNVLHQYDRLELLQNISFEPVRRSLFCKN